MVVDHKPLSRVRRWFSNGVVGLGALTCTAACFFVLPLIQAITKLPQADFELRAADTVSLPPPPPPTEPEPEEPPPPELAEQTQTLSQLELALNAGLGGGWMSGDFGVQLNSLQKRGADEGDALFSLADLDQAPRVVHQPVPAIPASLRKRTPATVHVLFVVDQTGRVESPIVQKTTDSAFDSAALAAVKKWKFDPGKRNGEPVRFRMRVPITIKG